MPTIELTNPAALPADWRDFLALTKPRVMSLVVFTGLCGLLVGAGACRRWCSASPRSCASRSAPARAARSTNGMRPTSTRRCGGPPSARFPPAGWTASRRSISASASAVFSVLLMGLATNWLAAALLAVSILFYVLVYTVWLKPRTAQNIVIGGAAGAFPPLIGWVAATGHVAALPLLLFAIIFLWTPPHFWALSLFVRSDYAAAGIPMLPVVAGVAEHAAPDLPLQPADGRGRGGALAARPDRPDLRRVARQC